jgi:hypothetical protein
MEKIYQIILAIFIPPEINLPGSIEKPFDFPFDLSFNPAYLPE